MEHAILDDKVRYYRTRAGSRGTTARARLYTDRVEIVARDGSLLDAFALTEVTEVKEAAGGVLWLDTGGERHGLCFVVFPFVLMGLMGVLLSGAGGLRRAWVEELAQLRLSRVQER